MKVMSDDFDLIPLGGAQVQSGELLQSGRRRTLTELTIFDEKHVSHMFYTTREVLDS